MKDIGYIVIFICFFQVAPLAAQTPYIMIDPGHGGEDPGAVGCGLEEKNVNLETSLNLRQLLQDNGFDVIMTREEDVYLTLASRTDYANAQRVDRFVAIHTNASSPPSTGVETFCYYTASTFSFDLRDKIQNEMLSIWQLRDRGVKTAGFYVLKHTVMPATLSELAFINNCTDDALYLSDSTELSRAAEAHLWAIQLHYGEDPEKTGQIKGFVYEYQESNPQKRERESHILLKHNNN